MVRKYLLGNNLITVVNEYLNDGLVDKDVELYFPPIGLHLYTINTVKLLDGRGGT